MGIILNKKKSLIVLSIGNFLLKNHNPAIVNTPVINSTILAAVSANKGVLSFKRKGIRAQENKGPQ